MDVLLLMAILVILVGVLGLAGIVGFLRAGSWLILLVGGLILALYFIF